MLSTEGQLEKTPPADMNSSPHDETDTNKDTVLNQENNSQPSLPEEVPVTPIYVGSPHVKEPSVTAHYEHYAHDEWSMRDLLHWLNFSSLPITFNCFEYVRFRFYQVFSGVHVKFRFKFKCHRTRNN
jgi:hypothetical protein